MGKCSVLHRAPLQNVRNDMYQGLGQAYMLQLGRHLHRGRCQADKYDFERGGFHVALQEAPQND